MFIRCELCLPIVEAQHSDWVRAGRGIVRRCEQAPGSGRDTKHAEVVATDDLRTGYVRSIVPHNAYLCRRSGDKTFERLAVIAQISIHRVREVLIDSAAMIAGVTIPR